MNTCRSTKTQDTGRDRLKWSCNRDKNHTGNHKAKGLNGATLKTWRTA